MAKPKRVYFHGLHELRAVAALGVLVGHVEIKKKREGMPSLYDTEFFSEFVTHLGKNCVYLFFVLSGFLITYLLLEEIKVSGKVDIRRFYQRRILRIWPLYYIVVGIGFVLLPAIADLSLFSQESYYPKLARETQYGFNLFLFLIFFSNLALKIYAPVAGASQSWSVSVEEQFYALWPVLMNRFKRNIPKLLLWVIAVKLTLSVVFYVLTRQFPHPAIVITADFLATVKIELMAVGGLGAYMLYHGKIPEIPKAFAAGLVLLIGLQLLLGGQPLLLGISFLGLILCVIQFRFENKLLGAVGEISYGIYMYHPLCILISFGFMNTVLNIEPGPTFQVMAYALTLATTLVVSTASYLLIEKPLLRIKSRIAVVKSGKA